MFSYSLFFAVDIETHYFLLIIHYYLPIIHYSFLVIGTVIYCLFTNHHCLVRCRLYLLLTGTVYAFAVAGIRLYVV